MKPIDEVWADIGGIRSVAATVEVTIRRCEEADLPALAWYNDPTNREIILATYEGQCRGDAIMLVAEANGCICGQVWLDLTRYPLDGTGVIWAIHVIPCMRNAGVGTALIVAAEEILSDRQFDYAELSVEKNNERAMQLYKRLGYRLIATKPCSQGVVTSDPVPILVPANQWLMRKPL